MRACRLIFMKEMLWVWMDLSSEHMEEIVSLTFQYIRYLKLHGIIPWLYEEVTYVYSSGFETRSQNSVVIKIM